MRLFYLCFVWLCCWSCQSSENSEVSYSISKENEAEIIRIALQDINLDSLSPAKSIEVQQDHSRHRTSRYRAHPLHPVIRWAIDQFNLDTIKTLIVWHCKDDYRPTNRLQEIWQRDDGYLAFADEDAGTKQWQDSMASAYAPFYLVWDDIPYDDHLLAWPYGLSHIEFLPEDPSKSLTPPAQANLTHGFDQYQLHCQKCHPLNGIGGNLGPEFNDPKNITTYWKREDIIAYAKNPQSYRRNSKMYAISSLVDKDFEAIVDYLAWLAEKGNGEGD